ncbi:MAG: PEP-CTERM sorting domain-containing protein [Phycisphaeraceae bacterium]|nr:PEP-CTERM sorting domain-containing protein [Phycisphaeraceae bacterium]
MMSGQIYSRLCAIACAVMLMGLVSSVAVGAKVCIDKDPDGTLFGNLKQGDIGEGGETMCGPVAAVNGFLYLQRKYPQHFNSYLIGDKDDDGEPDTYEDMKKVAEILGGLSYMDCGPGGVSYNRFIDGKYAYMEEVAPGKTKYRAQSYHEYGGDHDWVADKKPPEIDFLVDQLKGCAAVEILIAWDVQSDEPKAHYVTVVKLCWEDANGDGKLQPGEEATIEFIDPRSGQREMGELTFEVWDEETFILIGYEEVPGSGLLVDAYVTMIMSQNIPEPATVVFMALGGLVVLIRRR